MSKSEETPSLPIINSLIDELKSEEKKKRPKAVESLPVMARALGPELTRNELLTFLTELTDDDDDILVILAEALGNFIPLIGGSANALSLLKPLEPLACVEETIIRDKVPFLVI